MKIVVQGLVCLGILVAAVQLCTAQSTVWQPSNESLIDLGRKVTISLPQDSSAADVGLEYDAVYSEQVEQTYSVCVPYTENVEQSYEVKVPYIEEAPYTFTDPESGEEVARTRSVTKYRTETRTRTVSITKTRTETRSRIVTAYRLRRESGAVPLDSVKFWTMAGDSVDTKHAGEQLQAGAACFLIYQTEDFAGDRFFAEMFSDNVLVVQCQDDLAKEICTGPAAITSPMSLRSVGRVLRQEGAVSLGLITYPIDQPKNRIDVPISDVRIWSREGKPLSGEEALQAFSKTRRCVVVPYAGEETYERSGLAEFSSAFASDVYVVSVLKEQANANQTAANARGGKKLPAEPLMHLTFDNDQVDPSQNSSNVLLRNVKFEDGALYVNGKYENGMPQEAAEAAVSRIVTPKLNYDAFTVAIRFNANQLSKLQRNIITGGKYHRWFGLHRNGEGRLTLTLNNAKFESATKFSLVPKKWYTLVCGVDAQSKRCFVCIDGKKVDVHKLPQDFQFTVASSDQRESDKVWSFTNYSNASVFHGYVDELLIFNEVLSQADMRALQLGE